jgi:hypothetical protein
MQRFNGEAGGARSFSRMGVNYSRAAVKIINLAGGYEAVKHAVNPLHAGQPALARS